MSFCETVCLMPLCSFSPKCLFVKKTHIIGMPIKIPHLRTGPLSWQLGLFGLERSAYSMQTTGWHNSHRPRKKKWLMETTKYNTGFNTQNNYPSVCFQQENLMKTIEFCQTLGEMSGNNKAITMTALTLLTIDTSSDDKRVRVTTSMLLQIISSNIGQILMWFNQF